MDIFLVWCTENNKIAYNDPNSYPNQSTLGHFKSHSITQALALSHNIWHPITDFQDQNNSMYIQIQI